MSELKEVLVPDIGDFSDVPVIEIFVEPGDQVVVEDPLMTLESDKATLDIPAPFAGTIRELKVVLGTNVSQGSVLLSMDVSGESSATDTHTADTDTADTHTADTDTADTDTAVNDSSASATPVETQPPAAPVTVAEVSSADAANQLEGVPDIGESADSTATVRFPSHPNASSSDPRAPMSHPLLSVLLSDSSAATVAHASPAVRYFARELGVDIAKVTGTGRKGRILKQDVNNHIRQAMTAPAPTVASAVTTTGSGIPPIPAVDFSKFGPIEEQQLSRIQKISGPHLQRAWLNVPHVTHHDEVDITELEAFRKSLQDEAAKQDLRITALAFILKALAKTLAAFPTVNASLSSSGESLILKRYFHIGIAVDTPNGLVVPVLRNVDQKGLFELAAEMGDISLRARLGKLKAAEMQGGCMSVSSLGGIGGTAFTPIVNAPEVAILGVTRARIQPVWNGSEFVPRLMLPLDLSYDHRVIDGAQAARFVAYLGAILGDVRRLLL